MSVLAWSALGVGVIVLPTGDPVVSRTRLLATRGRFVLAPVHPPRWRAPRGEAVLAVVSVLAVFAVLLLAGPVLAAAAGIGCATVVRTIQRAQHRRRESRNAIDLLAAVRLISAELENGTSVDDALCGAATVAPAHAGAMLAAADAYRHGHDPPWDDPDLRGVAAAWQVSAQTGAPLAAVLARVADDLAARNEQRQAVTGAVAGARSSAGLLAGLPALGLALGAAMAAHPLHVLFGTPSGRVLCLAGVGLDAAGVMWTQCLTSRAERT